MLVQIQIERRVHFSKVIDMPQEEYERLGAALDAHGKDRKEAEREIDNMLGPDDWQDETFEELWAFHPAKEEATK